MVNLQASATLGFMECIGFVNSGLAASSILIDCILKGSELEEEAFSGYPI